MFDGSCIGPDAFYGWPGAVGSPSVCAFAESTIELEVKVEGMKCGGCSSRVEAALKVGVHT